MARAFFPSANGADGPLKRSIVYVTPQDGETIGRVQIAVRLFKLWDSYEKKYKVRKG
jgi:hypothetical protein